MIEIKLADIEQQTESFASAAKALDDELRKMEDELEAVRRKYTDALAALSKEAAEEKALLMETIAGAPHLFQKPKTVVISGIKVGFRKQKGTLKIVDMENTVKLIKNKLPEYKSTLIRTREDVIKDALGQLTVAELRSIGVEVTADTDEPTITFEKDVITGLVAKMIEEHYALQTEEA